VLAEVLLQNLTGVKLSEVIKWENRVTIEQLADRFEEFWEYGV
jgi:hypothetical protein